AAQGAPAAQGGALPAEPEATAACAGGTGCV
ncbi:hypothetical protein BMJ26_23220, partial [Sinorhizobium medicae]